jgi:hypothetical protein
MNPLDFAALIIAIGPDAAYRIMNAARPAGDYLFATFLPEILKTTYQAKSGYMTVRATMAGLVGADSPYPPSGIVDASDFSEQTAKIANSSTLTEMALRELQSLLQILGAGQASNDAIRGTALNFLDKIIVQAHLDTMEYLRGQALVTGGINWTFNKINLLVDYGIPAGNLLTARAGADGYGGSTSKFWTDMRAARSKLKGQVRVRLAHPDTIDMIVNNDANKVRMLAQDDVTGTVTIGKIVGNTEQLSSDARDRLTLVGYGLEGEIVDPANPGKTIPVPFLPRGKVLSIGNPIPAGFQIGQGSTPTGQNALPVGYTHIAPTVEGGGRPGRWARLRTPEERPWQLAGEGVTNGLPVIEAPEKLVIATTDMV